MSKIKYQKNISVLNLKCYSCFSKDHQMGECPFLHYIPNKKKIIALHNHNNMIENRKSFKRSNRKYNYKNCRLIRNEVEKSTKNFIDDFENIQSFINSFDSISDEEDLELNSNENDLNHLHHLNNFIGTKEELEFNFKEKENNKKDIKLKKKTSKQFEEKIHKEQEIVQFDEKIKKFHENSEGFFFNFFILFNYFIKFR